MCVCVCVCMWWGGHHETVISQGYKLTSLLAEPAYKCNFPKWYTWEQRVYEYVIEHRYVKYR